MDTSKTTTAHSTATQEAACEGTQEVTSKVVSFEGAFDTTKHHAPLSLGDVLVLGLGKSGKAASSYCAALLGGRVTSLTVAAGASTPEARAYAEHLESQGATVLFDTYEFSRSYDVAIASPGISQFSDFYQAAAQCAPEVISEVEFAWRESAADSVWVAITGTNGKTTTTALTAHLLQTCGLPAAAVGNIGDTCLDAVAQGSIKYYVAEVSSYQLASTVYFKPDVAVLLNITPDHLKWHRSFEAYCEAKRKVYACCDEASTVVLDATNDVVRGYVRELRAQTPEERSFSYIPLGTAQGLYSSMIDACGAEQAAYIDGSTLTVVCKGVHHTVGTVDDLLIKGEHNASNALAAASAALALGCDEGLVRKGLASFQPLEHRIEPCGTVQGVRCYNDSKATNVDATLKALAAFGTERPIVLLGGDDKGTDLAELVQQAEQHCKAVVCFGAAGPRFYDAFSESPLMHVPAKGLEHALDVALGQAVAGDIVILSPACASFDEFSCFEERGEVFKQLVAQRSTERGA